MTRSPRLFLQNEVYRLQITAGSHLLAFFSQSSHSFGLEREEKMRSFHLSGQLQTHEVRSSLLARNTALTPWLAGVGEERAGGSR